MYLRDLYVNNFIPAYSDMLFSLDNDVVGQGKMLRSAKVVCDICNNFVDYIANNNPEYILESWGARDAKEFRDNLEEKNHMIMGVIVKGNFFGVIRDVANTSKHVNVGRPPAQVQSTGNTRESLSFIRYKDEHGYYYSYRPTVIARHVDEYNIPLEIYLYLCFLSFSSILVDLNEIPNKPDILERRSFYKSRDEAACDIVPSIEVTEGEPLNLALSSFIYQDEMFSELRAMKSDDDFYHTSDINIIYRNGLFSRTAAKTRLEIEPEQATVTIKNSLQ